MRPRAAIQTILMTPTATEVGEFVARWRSVADVVRVEAVREYQGVEALSLFDPEVRGESRACPALWSYLVVLSDMRATPCCSDINGDLALGDVRETPIMELWRGPALRRLRRAHLALDFSALAMCARCEFTNVDLVRRKAEACREWQ